MKTYTGGGATTLLLAASETTPLLPLITMPRIGYLLCLCYPPSDPPSISIMWYLNLHKNVIKMKYPVTQQSSTRKFVFDYVLKEEKHMSSSNMHCIYICISIFSYENEVSCHSK